MGYNHARDLRVITLADMDKVMSRLYSEELLQRAKFVRAGNPIEFLKCAWRPGAALYDA